MSGKGFGGRGGKPVPGLKRKTRLTDMGAILILIQSFYQRLEVAIQRLGLPAQAIALKVMHHEILVATLEVTPILRHTTTSPAPAHNSVEDNNVYLADGRVYWSPDIIGAQTIEQVVNIFDNVFYMRIHNRRLLIQKEPRAGIDELVSAWSTISEIRRRCEDILVHCDTLALQDVVRDVLRHTFCLRSD